VCVDTMSIIIFGMDFIYLMLYSTSEGLWTPGPTACLKMLLGSRAKTKNLDAVAEDVL